MMVLCFSATASAQMEVAPSTDVVPDDGRRAREDTFESTRGLGMGTGARASAVGTSAIAYNPANLALARLYHVGAFVGFVPQAGAWSFGSAIADSVTSQLTAGLSFRGIYGNGSRNYRGYDGRLALAYGLSPAIALGVSGRYVRLSSEDQNEAGQTVGAGVKAFTVDAAIRVTPVEGLHIAALGYNLIRTKSPLAPMLLGGSASYSMGTTFSIAADVLIDMTTFAKAQVIFGGGAEYLAGDTVPIRIGFRREHGRKLNQITAAVGYVDQNFGVDLALRQDIASDESDTQLLLSFRYHVDPGQ